jgi:hypothetical protein
LSDSDWQIRAKAVALLGGRKEKGVPNVLLSVIHRDRNLKVVWYAVNSFRSITESYMINIVDVKGLEKWWKVHSAEVNERLAPAESQ